MDKQAIIVALDYDDAEQALALARQLNPQYCRLKVGKALFTRAGQRVVTQLHDWGFEVFLDLKYHDIPATVAGAVKAAADLGVWMVNVHALGGEAMLQAASEALANYQQKPLLIGVTVLTSMNEAMLKQLGVERGLAEQVDALAALTMQAGLDGIVCSAQEAARFKQTYANGLTVTPGIRPLWASRDDQQRVLTPTQALANGSDYLVIGRPITASDNPLQALETIWQEIEQGA